MSDHYDLVVLGAGPGGYVAAVRAGYRSLADFRNDALTRGLEGAERASELSMGMSGDFEIAIAAGATIVRIGAAAFGPRPPA